MKAMKLFQEYHKIDGIQLRRLRLTAGLEIRHQKMGILWQEVPEVQVAMEDPVLSQR